MNSTEVCAGSTVYLPAAGISRSSWVRRMLSTWVIGGSSSCRSRRSSRRVIGRWWRARRSWMGVRRGAVDREGEIVEVAVPPVLTRFVGLDDRVVLRGEVRGGVPVGRVVTAADVATRHAHPQVHPLAADAQAVLAPGAARGDVDDLVEVRAGLAH